MKMVFSVELDNRHSQDSALLEACMKDALEDFNRRTRAKANMKLVRLLSDEFDVMSLTFDEQRRTTPQHHFRNPRD
jgi:hypothetical protein